MSAENAQSHGHGAAASHGAGHVVSPKILFATAAVLLALTFITVTAAKVDFAALEMPELNIFVALGIAVVKASLVCLFFMHLRWDRPFNGFLIVGSVALVALFIAFAITDSAEYQPDVIKEESTLVQGELAKLPPPLTTGEIRAIEAQPKQAH
jgi:cytochrome c oxidase subunit 4